MYVLTEEMTPQGLSSNGAQSEADAVKWRMVRHTQPPRFAMVVWALNKYVSSEFTVEERDDLRLEFGAALPKISSDGLDLIVRFCTQDARTVLCSEIVLTKEKDEDWRQVVLPMAEHIGQTGVLEIECGPGPEKNPRADWLAITECVVCTPEQISLGRARMHRQRRSDTEIKHFANTYEMPMFKPDAKPNAFSVAQQIVGSKILKNPLNFAHRLHQMAKDRPLRIASLCCGSGRTERMLIRGIEDRISITMIDINQGLLDQASELLSEVSHVDTICSDVNEFDLPENEYDVVMCVSALHHVIELESLVDEVANGLVVNGEFWSIAEYVGRTGARLWPESYDAADAIFSELPEKFRENHAAGEKVIDDHLRNVNCALNTFEGVRSEDIMPILESRLKAEQVDRWSTIIWRVLGPAYVPNYDVEKVVDRALVEFIAHRDVEFQKSGTLLPVAMKGIFRRP